MFLIIIALGTQEPLSRLKVIALSKFEPLLLLFFIIIYSRKVQIYIADTRFQGRNQEKHMVI